MKAIAGHEKAHRMSLDQAGQRTARSMSDIGRNPSRWAMKPCARCGPRMRPSAERHGHLPPCGRNLRSAPLCPQPLPSAPQHSLVGPTVRAIGVLMSPYNPLDGSTETVDPPHTSLQQPQKTWQTTKKQSEAPCMENQSFLWKTNRPRAHTLHPEGAGYGSAQGWCTRYTTKKGVRRWKEGLP